MEAANYQDREDMIQIRIKTQDSYQMKKIIEAIEKDSNFLLMSKSEVKKIKGPGPRLRVFASFKDIRKEKKNNKQHR